MNIELDRIIESFSNPEKFAKSARVAMEIRANCEGLRLRWVDLLYEIPDNDFKKRSFALGLGILENNEIKKEDLDYWEEKLGITKGYLSDISNKSLDEELQSIRS
ncbi:hypothetical protein M1145_01550 [Patescibacteria group bacterium]|nr:hypothetical protein [Patescibacteria group bacterium]